MDKYIYVIFIIFMALLPIITILRSCIDRRKRKDSEIIVLNNKVSLMGILFFVLFIIWVVLVTKNVLKVYSILNKGYIDSIFQMLNLKSIDRIIEDFYKSNDVIRYLYTYNYVTNFLRGLYWIVFSFSLSITHFYRGAMRNIIYNEGIIVNDDFYKWEKFNCYYWSGPYEKSFKEGTYYKLVLKLPKFYDLENELVLNISDKDKEAVDKTIIKYVFSNQNLS